MVFSTFIVPLEIDSDLIGTRLACIGAYSMSNLIVGDMSHLHSTYLHIKMWEQNKETAKEADLLAKFANEDVVVMIGDIFFGFLERIYSPVIVLACIGICSSHILSTRLGQ